MAVAAGMLGAGPAAAEMLASTGPTPASLRRLARQLQGRVVRPGNPGYAQGRLVYDRHFDAVHPKAIVYAASTADVERTVHWARKNGVHLVARSGGHSYGGYSTTGSGVVLDVSRLHGVALHPSGTALVGAGALLIDVYAKLWAHRRSIPAGSCPTVGVAGLTLGGGHGWSSRRFGLTSDNITELTIVTADGQARVCSAHENQDLFWACRGGGGGNFGVVTNFTFKTHAVDGVSTFTATWPWSDAARVFKAWQEWAPHAPKKLGLSVLYFTSGPPPAFGVSGQFFGRPAALTSLIHPLTSIGHPNVSVKARTYMEAVLLHAGCSSVAACRIAPREAFKAKSAYARKPVSAHGIDVIVKGIENWPSGAGGFALILDSYGGAINAVPPGATAFSHRKMLFSLQYYASPGTGPNLAALTHFYKTTRPFLSSAAYVNYIDPALPNWAHAYYGANYPRLVAVKKQVDPTNFFHFRQSIRRHV